MARTSNRKRNLIILAVVAVLVVGVAAAVVVSSTSSNHGMISPVPAAGYFTTLPPGAALPSDADCAARVHRSSWEPRADNYAANHTTPPSGYHVGRFSQWNAAWNANYWPRIDGQFTGTTDEIIQFEACKWGWSDNLVRAQAVVESDWHQSNLGDYESTGSGHCVPDGFATSSRGCPTSFGIIQVKWYFHPVAPAASSYPYIRTSTAFNLDLQLAEMRGCYDGMSTYLGNTRGDQMGCLGSWYSGDWRDPGALAYVQRVQTALKHKDWQGWRGQVPRDLPRSQSGTSMQPADQGAALRRLESTKRTLFENSSSSE